MIEQYIRPNIKAMTAYQSARHDFTGDAQVFLDANELPYTTGYNRYPDPYQSDLKRLIGLKYRMSNETIFLANGSDEVLDLVFRLFCRPGIDNVVAMDPSYGMYKVLANVNDIELRKVALDESFDINVEGVIAQIDENTKIIFLCSPNNPSSNLLSLDKIKTLLDSGKIVLIDEAYIDFADQKSTIDLLSQYQNLIVIQTLSKSKGLAGLRIGVAYASPTIINYLNRIKPPYNISTANIKEAIRILNTTDFDLFCKTIIEQREYLKRELRKLNIVKKVFPSDANFLLVRFENSNEVFRALKDSGIVVRDRSHEFGCENCLRISVGKESENKQLLEALINISK